MSLTTMPHLSLTFGLLMSATAFLHAGNVLTGDTGMIQVYVSDENGAAVRGAPVYLKDGSKTEYLETDAKGAVSFTAQQGKYTVSSALSQPSRQGELIDRFVSPSAHIALEAQDTTTVLLVLRPLESPIYDLSASALRKIGVADEVAKYLN